jgi:hypothetical protein
MSPTVAGAIWFISVIFIVQKQHPKVSSPVDQEHGLTNYLGMSLDWNRDSSRSTFANVRLKKLHWQASCSDLKPLDIGDPEPRY